MPNWIKAGSVKTLSMQKVREGSLLNKSYSGLLKQLFFPYWKEEQEKSSFANNFQVN